MGNLFKDFIAMSRYEQEKHVLVSKAASLAVLLHRDQFRRDGKTPFITHPSQVASVLIGTGCEDAEMIAAAWLHDTIEDCDLMAADLEELINNHKVIQYVVGLTNPSKKSDGNRAKRKQIDREHVAAQIWEVQLIKLCDRYCNLTDTYMDLLNNFSDDNRSFAKLYVGESRLLLEVLGGLDETIYRLSMGLCDSIEHVASGMNQGIV